MVMKMDVKDQIFQGVSAWRAEIEQAIDIAKPTEMDKWWRRQFYRETWWMARDRRRGGGAGRPWREPTEIAGVCTFLNQRR